jgi:hypothetical protein
MTCCGKNTRAFGRDAVGDDNLHASLHMMLNNGMGSRLERQFSSFGENLGSIQQK